MKGAFIEKKLLIIFPYVLTENLIVHIFNNDKRRLIAL